jgi:hypothetical protein
MLHTSQIARPASSQGCQMLYFQTKNPNLGRFWSALQCKMLVNSKAFWSILLPLGKAYGHLVHSVVISVYFYKFWYVVPMKIWQPCSWRKRTTRENIVSAYICMHGLS